MAALERFGWKYSPNHLGINFGNDLFRKIFPLHKILLKNWKFGELVFEELVG